MTSGEPRWNIVSQQSGLHAGQRQATYAVPITGVTDREGREVENTAIVFNKFYTQSEIENAEETLNRIEGLALLAAGLALLIAGFAGYFAAVLISRRVGRLNVAAERLSSGNFDERINTHVGDELGSLASSFNAMAASMKDAFGQIEQEKERGNAILNGMTDAVVGVDRNLETVFRNPRAIKLLESTPHEFHVRLQEVLAKTHYWGPVTEPEAQAGDRIIEIRAAPLEDGALAILRDVTEERRVQRAKADFIANASHELKTPSRPSPVTWRCSRTRRTRGTDQVPERDARPDRAPEGPCPDPARPLAAGRQRRHLPLGGGLPRGPAPRAASRVRLHGAPLDVRAEENVPPVETDPNQLHRMLAILVDNAIKYSEDGSPVELEALPRRRPRRRQRRRPRVRHPAGRDTPHLRPLLPRPGSSRADGTGLGLALAQEITEHLGGEIRVHSRPNVGSTFDVLLPLPNIPQPLQPQRIDVA